MLRYEWFCNFGGWFYVGKKKINKCFEFVNEMII